MMKGWQRAPATIMGCSADFRLTVLKNNSSLVKKASASPKDANVAPAIGRENYFNLACPSLCKLFVCFAYKMRRRHCQCWCADVQQRTRQDHSL